MNKKVHGHRMVVREFPAMLEAPKTADFGQRGTNHESAHSYLRSHSNSQHHHQHVNQNVHYLNEFLSQMGSIQSEKPDLNTNGGLHGSKLGYDNPGLILENDNESPSSVTNNNLHDPKQPRSSTSSRNSTARCKHSLYFNDGIRRIDMILVFEDNLDLVKEQRRKGFIRNLANEGVDIEMENPDPTERFNQESRTRFVKVHAPWSVLVKYAEIMNMKMPIKEKTNSTGPEAPSRRRSWMKLSFFDYNQERIPPEPSFHMASFSRQNEKCFIIKDRETFFNSAQRSQIVWKILTRVRCDDTTRAKNGIRRLLNEHAFIAAYPLHEGPYDEEYPGEEPNDRRLLYKEWAHFSNWYKRQPLGLVRRYFGDKVGLYFAWLGFYTAMLVPASIVGILCFLFGITTKDTDYNTPSREICAKSIGGQIVMCPLCGDCTLWSLDDSCTFSKLTYFFDNPATIFFAIFMAFWATSFLEFWKRKHAVIAWEWDLHSYEIEEEPRPEFEAAVKTFRINPVTQTPEPFLSFWSKALRMLVVSSIVFLLLFIVAFVVMGIIIYRLVMTTVLYTMPEDSYVFTKENSKLITSISAGIINLITVVFLRKRVLYNVAIWLTNSEFPRTQTEYEDSFTFKMFLFQFINYYSYLIYIAFFKGRFFRHPGVDSNNVFEIIRGDMCDPAGCLSELFIQLSIIMIGKQILNNFKEFFMPKLNNWFRRLRYKTVVNAPVFLTRWEQDYNLKQIDQLALFREYLEMVIQYGFVTLFVAAFPLAPFFALLNNIVEIRLDAYKWITQMRRPLAERVEDIGAWFGILQVLSYCSFCSSAFLIAYTSDIIPRLVYKYTSDDSSLQGYINSSLSIFSTVDNTDRQRFYNGANQTTCRYRGYYNPSDGINELEPSDLYWHIMAARLAFVAVFEHLAFALTGIMAFAIPDVPREVNVQIQREKLLAYEVLYENDLARLQREKEIHMDSDITKRTLRRRSSIAQELLLSFNKDTKSTENVVIEE